MVRRRQRHHRAPCLFINNILFAPYMRARSVKIAWLYVGVTNGSEQRRRSGMDIGIDGLWINGGW